MYEKRFISLVLILAVNLLSYAYFLKQSSGFAMNFLAIGLLLLLSIVSFGGIGFNAKWGWALFTLLFTLNLAYLLYIFYNSTFLKFALTRWLFMANGALVLLGFMISALSKHEEEFDFDDDDDDFDESKETEDNAEAKEESKESPKVEIVEDFSSGKYVGSNTGNKYHAPKCDWAKKIKKSKEVWFNSEQEAKKKGYTKHSCI